jgi:DNA-binding transcriptional MerR regulator
MLRPSRPFRLGRLAMMSEALKVGEVARRTGLTFRTFHHYDEICLLKPSLHTGARYRLYTGRDIARLQHVVSLRQLGLSLEDLVVIHTHQSGIGPDGKPFDVTGFDLFRVQDAMLAEHWDASAPK